MNSKTKFFLVSSILFMMSFFPSELHQLEARRGGRGGRGGGGHQGGHRRHRHHHHDHDHDHHHHHDHDHRRGRVRGWGGGGWGWDDWDDWRGGYGYRDPYYYSDFYNNDTYTYTTNRDINGFKYYDTFSVNEYEQQQIPQPFYSDQGINPANTGCYGTQKGGIFLDPQ